MCIRQRDEAVLDDDDAIAVLEVAKRVRNEDARLVRQLATDHVLKYPPTNVRVDCR